MTVNEAAVLKEVGKFYHVCPTFNGGRDWPSSAYNPKANVMYVQLLNLCIDLRARADRDAAPRLGFDDAQPRGLQRRRRLAEQQPARKDRQRRHGRRKHRGAGDADGLDREHEQIHRGGAGQNALPQRLQRVLTEAERRDAGEAAGGGGVATATKAAPIVAPVGTGPGGHTQRLLTVVKAGSIQDVKATPVDKVHTWPHLLAVEFVASLVMLAFVLIFSIFVNAPLLEIANVNNTPNPSKAPWYFLGLQELLTMFHPMVAGVTIPGMGIFLLILAPYIDRNPSNKPEDRKFAIGVFTVQLDFGVDAFPGANRFVEIGVKPAGGGSYTTLAPRVYGLLRQLLPRHRSPLRSRPA
mgnify:CR=1 FL=1